MDYSVFDQFTKAVSAKSSRRKAIRTLAATVVGGGVALTNRGVVDAKKAKSDCCPAAAPKLCDLTCTDLSNDAANCGTCGNVCPTGSSCVSGACTCPAGTTNCGGTCVDLASSAAHCGSCGHTCETGSCRDGICAECQTADECPQPDWECSIATCVNGRCDEITRPQGTILDEQIDGDCKQRVCGMPGSIIEIDDSADLPDDGNECTASICIGGSPSNPPLEAGIVCSQDEGAVCDGAGNCVQCNLTGDCPSGQPCIDHSCRQISCSNYLHCGTAPDCYEYQCTEGTCEAVPVPAGYWSGYQVDGDCRRHICDGSGGITSEPWDEDAPYDPFNECRIETCENGMPVTLFPGPETVCMNFGTGACDGFGNCVVPKQLGEWCTNDAECVSGHCNGGACCESACDSQCLSCHYHQNGVSSGACLPVVAGTDPGLDCPGDDFCDGNGACTQCLTNAHCPAEKVCVSGGCSEIPQCTSAADCGSAEDCNEFLCTNGSCLESPLPAGSPATVQITGDCRRSICDGSGGITWEPDDADLFDDLNQCTVEYCSGGTMIAEPLPVGTACNQDGGSQCDGSGACV